MVQRFRNGEVLVLPADVQRNLAFLNAAFVGVLTVYWLLFIGFFFNLDWIGSLPIATKVLVPFAMTLATFGAARVAAAYTKRTRGPEDIDTRISVGRWLLIPVIFPALFLSTVVIPPLHWTGLMNQIAEAAIAAIVGLAWSRYYVGPDIGDFTFE